MASQPTTALVAVGEAMIFKPSGEVLAEQVRQKEDMVGALEGKVELSSLDIIHIVIASNEFDKLYDENAIAEYVPLLKDNGGEMNVHLLCGEGNRAGEDMLNSIKMSFVLGNLRLEQMAEGADGSFALTAYKGSKDADSDPDDEEEENDKTEGDKDTGEDFIEG